MGVSRRAKEKWMDLRGRWIGTRSGQWRKDRTTGVFAVENEYAEEARKYVKAASRGRRL